MKLSVKNLLIYRSLWQRQPWNTTYEIKSLQNRSKQNGWFLSFLKNTKQYVSMNIQTFAPWKTAPEQLTFMKFPHSAISPMEFCPTINYPWIIPPWQLHPRKFRLWNFSQDSYLPPGFSPTEKLPLNCPPWMITHQKIGSFITFYLSQLPPRFFLLVYFPGIIPTPHFLNT